MESFLPILILTIVALTVCVSIFLLTTFLGPRKLMKTKLSVYECGVTTEGGAHAPFKNRFYLIAVLFLLIDVEAAFFFPWALIYRENMSQGPALLIAFLIYLSFVILGLFFIFKKNALELNR